MLNFHKSHKNLVNTSLAVFAALSIVIAVLPASQLQKTEPLSSMKPYTPNELNGLKLYTSENCMSCHTQQVRNIEMDKIWGDRPSIPSDYFYSKQRMDVWRQSPSLLGSERTGPDLTNVGKRQPGKEWHLLHLYNPRIVVKESIMPGYPWLFDEKAENELSENDVVVPVPSEFLKNSDTKIIASQEVLDLVAYLQSLKQASLENQDVEFIPSVKKQAATTSSSEPNSLPDGKALYTSNCAACHQSTGTGLAGAFPSLAGSEIVNDANPELLIRIILQGYDARPEFAVMTGFEEILSDEEIAAIATHERSSWGNNAPPVSAEEVKKIRAYIQTLK